MDPDVDAGTEAGAVFAPVRRRRLPRIRRAARRGRSGRRLPRRSGRYAVGLWLPTGSSRLPVGGLHREHRRRLRPGAAGGARARGAPADDLPAPAARYRLLRGAHHVQLGRDRCRPAGRPRASRRRRRLPRREPAAGLAAAVRRPRSWAASMAALRTREGMTSVRLHGPAKRLTVFIGESDRYHHRPLYMEIVHRAHAAGPRRRHGAPGHRGLRCLVIGAHDPAAVPLRGPPGGGGRRSTPPSGSTGSPSSSTSSSPRGSSSSTTSRSCATSAGTAPVPGSTGDPAPGHFRVPPRSARSAGTCSTRSSSTSTTRPSRGAPS